MAETEPTPSPAEVRAQLERLLASRELAGSDRSRALLRYVVETTLAGRAEEIKAYTIAVDALGRGGDFDAQTDSTVRVEASRLRRKLLHYYLTEGAGDPVRIELPAQGYVPLLRYAPGAAAAPAAEPTAAGAGLPARLPPAAAAAAGLLLGLPLGGGLAWLVLGEGAPPSAAVEPAGDRASDLPAGVRIAVLSFDDLAREPALGPLAQGMAEALTSRLARQRELFVVARRGTSDPAAGFGSVDYVVEGSVRADAERIRLAASLVATADGRIVWRDEFDRPRAPAHLMALEDELAAAVLRALAEARGVELGLVVAAEPGPVRDLAAYECVLQAAVYRRGKTPEAHGRIRDCLERAVDAEPGYAAAWASLALIRLDEHFLRFDPGPDPLAAAARAAEAAMRLDPSAALSHRARLGVAFAEGDLAAFHAAAERGLALEPNNADLLADYAQKLGWLGDWQRARPLIVKAFLLNPDPPDWYRGVLALDAYRRGAYLDALAQILAMRDRDGLEASWLQAITLAQLGDASGARDALRRARALVPDLPGRIEEDLRRRRIAPDLAARLREGYRKAAGLEPPARVGP